MRKYKLLNCSQSVAKLALVVIVAVCAIGLSGSAHVSAAASGSCTTSSGTCVKVDDPKTKAKPADTCGSGPTATAISVNIGCKGQGNAMTDAVFAIIRFLSTGVGLVIVASTVWAGVQYSLARDDPQQVSAAKARITSNLEALLIYIFAYAILNYLIPGQFLK
jgi:hypothetical protein